MRRAPDICTVLDPVKNNCIKRLVMLAVLRGAFPSRCCQVFTHTGFIAEVFSFFVIYLEVTDVLIWCYINTTELN